MISNLSSVTIPHKIFRQTDFRGIYTDIPPSLLPWILRIFWLEARIQTVADRLLSETRIKQPGPVMLHVYCISYAPMSQETTLILHALMNVVTGADRQETWMSLDSLCIVTQTPYAISLVGLHLSNITTCKTRAAIAVAGARHVTKNRDVMQFIILVTY